MLFYGALYSGGQIILSREHIMVIFPIYFVLQTNFSKVWAFTLLKVYDTLSKVCLWPAKISNAFIGNIVRFDLVYTFCVTTTRVLVKTFHWRTIRLIKQRMKRGNGRKRAVFGTWKFRKRIVTNSGVPSRPESWRGQSIHAGT